MRLILPLTALCTAGLLGACSQEDPGAGPGVAPPVVDDVTRPPGGTEVPLPTATDPTVVDPLVPPTATAPAVVDCAAGVAPRIYRLSVEQYANALQELLGLAQAPSVNGDTEAAVSFFPRDEAPVQAGLAAGFSSAVDTALNSVDLDTLAGCTGQPDELACAQTFLADFAARAFGRPLDATERAALLEAPGSPLQVAAVVSINNGIRLALEGILQAPSFVYRRELGNPADGRLDSFETATQLGFLLRDSLPDETLRTAAQAGQLQTDEQILAQVDRMLALPEVQDNLTRVVGGWFGVDKVLAASKDPTAFPGFNDQDLQGAMLESGRLFIQSQLWTNAGTLLDLWTSPSIFLNGPLASAYGLEFDGATPADFVEYSLPEQRAGIMTQPAILTAGASTTDTSIVKRGLFVVRNALCLPQTPPPPPGVFAQVAAQLADTATSERQKADSRLSTAPCNACHPTFDPYGIVLENYDSIGAFTTVDGLGQPVNASATVPESLILPADQRDADADATEVVNGALQFVQAVAQGNQFAVCAERQLLSYGIGQALANSCNVEAVLGPADINTTVPDVFRKIVVSSLMRQRVAAAGGL